MIENLAAGQQVFTSNAFLVTGDRRVLVDTGSGFDVAAAVRERRATDDATPDDSGIDDATPNDATLDAVVLTHTHPDHVGNVADVVEAFDVDVWGYDASHDLVDHSIADGDRVPLGDHDYRALHTPGHKNDHLCLYAAEPGVCFAGDLVFAGGSFGRTDLPEGDRDRLVRSIEYLLETVEGSLAALHTGHGPSVTDDPSSQIEAALRAARF